MKINYKGYDIDVFKEKCLGGWEQTYYSIFRCEDGLEIVSSFTEGSDSVRDMIKYMKHRVDELIETKGDSENLAEEFEIK